MIRRKSSMEIIAGEPLLLSLKELAVQAGVEGEQVLAMVDEGLIEPVSGSSPQAWRFHADCVRRVTMALRLQRDLQINLAGAALAVQLLDEIHYLQCRVETLERLLDGD